MFCIHFKVQRVQKSMEALNLRECPDESIASVVNDLKAKVKSEIFSASLASVGPNMDLAQRTRDIKRNLALSLLEDDSDASPSQCIPPKSSSSAPIPVAHPRPEFFPPHPWMSHPMPMPHQMPIVYPESFYPYPPYNMYPHAFPPSPWMSHPMPQPGPFFGNPPQHPLPYPILDQGFPMGENRNVIPNSHSIPPFYPPYPYMPY